MKYVPDFCVGLLIGCILLGQADAALAADAKVALVVGQSRYRYARPLANPVNDAQAINRSLRALGYAVIFKTDVPYRDLQQTVADFQKQIVANPGTAVFFYAGHGMQRHGVNYLIPVDGNIQDVNSSRLDESFLSLNAVLAVLQQAKLGVAIFDACRNDPFADSRGLSRTKQPEKAEKADYQASFAEMKIGQGDILIAFSTSPGNLAEDGVPGRSEVRNSPYTYSLQGLLQDPRLDILNLFRKLSNQVKDLTMGRQVPWTTYSSLPEFCFPGCTNRRPPDTGALSTPDATPQGGISFQLERCRRSGLRSVTCSVDIINQGLQRQVEISLRNPPRLTDAQGQVYSSSYLELGQKRNDPYEGIFSTLVSGRHSQRLFILFEDVPDEIEDVQSLDFKVRIAGTEIQEKHYANIRLD
jgi:hypothetical protein